MASLENSSFDPILEAIARENLRTVPAGLRDAILYSLLGPGKRIRPRLVLAMSDALQLSEPVSHRIATAIEMTHAYTLIHDDLPAMDNDDFRRGKPTNHKVYGEGVAILAGDSLALLAPAVLLPLREYLTTDRVLRLVETVLEVAGSTGVISGQAAEMVMRPTSLPSLLEIFRLKTGSLFRACLTAPAIAAGTEDSQIKALGKLGDAMGIAFQIADDLEDEFAEKRADPCHLAAYVTAEEGREKGRDILTQSFHAATTGTDPDTARIGERLTPFIEELMRKLSPGVSP
jgi:geranylgeranyl diphosphate synthase type II